MGSMGASISSQPGRVHYSIHLVITVLEFRRLHYFDILGLGQVETLNSKPCFGAA